MNTMRYVVINGRSPILFDENFPESGIVDMIEPTGVLQITSSGRVRLHNEIRGVECFDASIKTSSGLIGRNSLDEDLINKHLDA